MTRVWRNHSGQSLGCECFTEAHGVTTGASELPFPPAFIMRSSAPLDYVRSQFNRTLESLKSQSTAGGAASEIPRATHDFMEM